MTSKALAWDPAVTIKAMVPPDIVALTAEACARFPERPVLMFEDGISISREAFLDAIERFAGYLKTRIGSGDRVAIMLENRVEFMIAWLATVANNAILVSINPSSGVHDTTHVIGDSGAALAIVGAAQEELVADIARECKHLREVVVVRDDEPGGLDEYGKDSDRVVLEEARIDPDAVTNIFYTSGTTGPPKGCMLGHEYWLKYVRIFGLTAEDRLLCCLPFFYGDPPWHLLASLHADTTLVVMRRFSVSRFWNVVREHRVTRLFSVASMPNLLLKVPPGPSDREHPLKLSHHAGIAPPSHKAFLERWGFPWVEVYGLTETGWVVSMPLEHHEDMVGSGSIGVAAPDSEVRICRDDGAECESDEIGEIVVRAPCMMRGYWNRPEETAATIRDGWLYTGDLGRRDARGFLYFNGRKKDIVRRAGENLAATEVESVLRSHPNIAEAAVIAVPDELYGEEVKAYVQLVEGVREEDLTPPEIVAFCQDRLAKHKVPRYIAYQAEPFPRTPTMRVKKADLRAVASDPTENVWDRENAYR